MKPTTGLSHDGFINRTVLYYILPREFVPMPELYYCTSSEGVCTILALRALCRHGRAKQARIPLRYLCVNFCTLIANFSAYQTSPYLCRSLARAEHDALEGCVRDIRLETEPKRNHDGIM